MTTGIRPVLGRSRRFFQQLRRIQRSGGTFLMLEVREYLSIFSEVALQALRYLLSFGRRIIALTKSVITKIGSAHIGRDSLLTISHAQRSVVFFQHFIDLVARPGIVSDFTRTTR